MKTSVERDESIGLGARGEFLGLIAFDPFTRSGLHQHQGIATSFILEGGLSDYLGPVNQHEVGINYRGSTHDAMAYVPTVLVSKLEGPVTYPVDAGVLSGIHAGSRHDSFRNPAHLAKMAASNLSYDDPEADEQALEEVAEFVRVAALLLHSDCVLAPRHRRSLN